MIYIYISWILIGLMETNVGIMFEAVLWDKLNTIAEASPWIHVISNYLSYSILFRHCLSNKQCDINPEVPMARSFTRNRVPVFIRVWQVVRSTFIMWYRERQTSTSVLTTLFIHTTFRYKCGYKIMMGHRKRPRTQEGCGCQGISIPETNSNQFFCGILILNSFILGYAVAYSCCRIFLHTDHIRLRP